MQILIVFCPFYPRKVWEGTFICEGTFIRINIAYAKSGNAGVLLESPCT